MAESRALPHWMDAGFDALNHELEALGEPRFRARQLFEAYKQHHAHSESRPTTWPVTLRDAFFQRYRWQWNHKLEHYIDSDDATQKWVVTLADMARTQMVMIPDGTRRTLCISSQVGCAMGCTFCSTGDMGFIRHLSAGEIVGQWLYVDHALRQRGDHGISNIVFMGMGEPLHNESHLRTALDWLTNKSLFNLAASRITVSTVGIEAPLLRLIDETDVNLAISLHAAANETRAQIVPAERGFSASRLRTLLESRAGRFGLRPGNRKLTLEVVALPELNMDRDAGKEIIAFARGLPAMVNLIPFNPYPGGRYERPEKPALLTLQRQLKNAGIPCFIRRTRGQRILAACGTLNTSDETGFARKVA